jgi:hypothetical protein
MNRPIRIGLIAEGEAELGTSIPCPLQIRWHLASQIDLLIIKTCCPSGYAAFAQDLRVAAKVVVDMISDQ